MTVNIIGKIENLYINAASNRILQLYRKYSDEYKNKKLKKINTFISDPVIMCHHIILLLQ